MADGSYIIIDNETGAQRIVRLVDNGDGTHSMGVSLTGAVAGEDILNDILKTEQRSSFMRLTASGQVKPVAGRIFGILVTAATSTPTIKVWNDPASTGDVLANTFTPVAGTFYPFMGAEFTNGCYISIGGTVDLTVFFK